MRRFIIALAALAVSPLALAQKAPDNYPGVIYNATPPTLGDKQATTVQADANGNIKTVPGSGSTQAAPYVLTPLATEQTLVLSGTAQSLTVPATAKYADFFPEGTPGTNNQCLRYRDDGTNPTASVGSGLAPQQLLTGYSGALSAIQFINATGATCTLTINYYK